MKSGIEVERDFIERVAQIDITQYKEDLLFGATGLALTGAGIALILTGNADVGAVMTVSGAGITYVYGKDASDCLESYTSSREEAARIQDRLDAELDTEAEHLQNPFGQ